MSAELEKQYLLMLEQESQRLDPDEERAQLLGNVRSDNAEISAMDAKIKETQIQIERIQNELKEAEDVRIYFNLVRNTSCPDIHLLLSIH